MISITNLTKKKIPKAPWQKIKEEILKKKYNLSLVFADNELMEKLNKKYRNKNKTAKTLSFKLNKNEGEIFLNINYRKKELIYFFIHSLLHLKGLEHGRQMERLEQTYLKKFLKDSANYYD